MANQLQIKRSLVGAYEEERAEPRLEVMESICALFSINLEQFLFQDLSLTGSMDGDGEGSSGNSYLERRRSLKSDKSKSLAPIVPFVPVKAAAGYLAGYADPEFLDELNTFTLPMLAPGDYRAFEIIGDSMLPTPSGSVIVGEKVASFKEVKNSNTYIVEIWKAVYIIHKAGAQPMWNVDQLAGVVNNLQDQITSLKKKLN
jgi:DNA-binding XRE family transcriptional regulator